LLRKLNSRVFCELCSQKTPRGTLPGTVTTQMLFPCILSLNHVYSF
jgi:hypothetical protein